MSKKAQGTVLVKWVRSGIGFPRSQKAMVRSLGLRRLNQVVERPDNAQTRGLVASIPHLVAIVGATPAPAWASMSEYKIGAPQMSQSSDQSQRAEKSEKAGRADQPQAAAPSEPSASLAASPADTLADARAGAESGEVESDEVRAAPAAEEEGAAAVGERPRRKRSEER